VIDRKIVVRLSSDRQGRSFPDRTKIDLSVDKVDKEIFSNKLGLIPIGSRKPQLF
jgi:hypothetical protein